MFVRLVTKIRAPMPSSRSLPTVALRWSSSSNSNSGGNNSGIHPPGVQTPAVAEVRTTTPYMLKDRSSIVNETQMSRDSALRQQTQPCRMPEFYNPSTDLSRLGQSSAGNSQQQQQRQFAVSKTYRSLTMPLKSSRLASPFPEPVKLMPSCQVSDQEKAQRMYNDSRLPGPRSN